MASTAKNTTSSSQTSSKSKAALSTLVRPSLLPFPHFFSNSLFTSGDDPFWEDVDIWYSATADQEWYDPQQLTTPNGSLVITLDSSTTTQAGLTPGTCFPSSLPIPFLRPVPFAVPYTMLTQTAGSTAPFNSGLNHNRTYRSGMLQSWNKFCFTSGYIEVSVVLPGPGQNSQGYVSIVIFFD